MSQALFSQTQYFLLVFARTLRSLELFVAFDNEPQRQQVQAGSKYIYHGITGIDIRQCMDDHSGQQDDAEPDAPHPAPFQEECPCKQEKKQRQPHFVVLGIYINGQELDKREHHSRRTEQFDFVTMPIQVGKKDETESGNTKIDNSQRDAGLPAYKSHPESNNPVGQQHAAQKDELISAILSFLEEIQI